MEAVRAVVRLEAVVSGPDVDTNPFGAVVVCAVARPVQNLTSEVSSGVAAADGEAVEVTRGFGAFIGGP